MTVKLNPPSFRFPHNISGKVHPDVEAAITDTFSGLVDNMQAWTSLKGTLDTLQTQVKTATTPSTPTNTVVTVLSTQFPGLGTVTDLTGTIAYTTQTKDNGAVIEVNDASTTNLTLNSTVATPYFFFVTNLGTATATLTPTSGLINGSASFNLDPNETAIVTFEGVDWVASGIAPGPLDTPPIAHEWLNSYVTATRTFGQSQPTAADVTNAADVTVVNTFTPAQKFTAGINIGTAPVVASLSWQAGVFVIEALIGGTVPIAMGFETFGTNANVAVQGNTAEVGFGLISVIGGSVYGVIGLVESNPANFLSASNTVEYQFGAQKNGTPGTVPPSKFAVGDVNIVANLPVLLAANPTVPLGAATKQYVDAGTVPLAISQTPDWPPATPTIYDDEFTSGSLGVMWSWVNQGTATVNVSKSYCGLIKPATVGDSVAAIVETVPATPWEFTMSFAYNTNNTGGVAFGGMAIRDSGTGKMILFELDQSQNLRLQNWTSPTVFSATTKTVTVYAMGGRFYLRIRDDGTNHIFSVSRDGVNFALYQSQSRTAFLANPNQAGFAANCTIAGGTIITSVDWFRRTL